MDGNSWAIITVNPNASRPPNAIQAMAAGLAEFRRITERNANRFAIGLCFFVRKFIGLINARSVVIAFIRLVEGSAWPDESDRGFEG
jgi:hypothetical protein